jgi:hypothetical protein
VTDAIILSASIELNKDFPKLTVSNAVRFSPSAMRASVSDGTTECQLFVVFRSNTFFLDDKFCLHNHI